MAAFIINGEREQINAPIVNVGHVRAVTASVNVWILCVPHELLDILYM